MKHSHLLNLSSKSTEWIKEVLDDEYTRCSKGRDFHHRKEELQEILWRREDTANDKHNNMVMNHKG